MKRIADELPSTTSTSSDIRPRPGSRTASAWSVVLLHATPGTVTQRFAPLRSTLTFGRDPSPGNVKIDQTTVSRAHARLTVHASGVEIADLGSHNGTFVNGERVDRAEVDEGDVLRVGNAFFLLVEGDGENVARYHVDGSVDPPGRLAEAREMLGGYRVDLMLAEVERIARTD